MAQDKLADNVANIVLSKFASLPTKYAPNKEQNNWIPLSGIVFEDESGHLECLSLATGMKCLPATKIALAKGRALHDSHAETLALRTLNHFLLQECLLLSKDENQESQFLERTSNGELPFTMRYGIKIHMYCSEAPCGDSSMELIMSKQADPTPWTTTEPDEQLPGRGYFSRLGVVRRKPSRADSPETLSKSCSDKLALRQCTGILSSQTSCLILPENAYLTSLVIPGSQCITGAMDRCFSSQGRLTILKDLNWPTGYAFRPFQILTTTTEFQFSRRSIPPNICPPKGSNMATIWNPVVQEVIINGILQGRKQSDKNCASMVSRSKLVEQICNMLSNQLSTSVKTYADLKRSHPQLAKRAEVKAKVIQEALVGWVANVEDNFDIRTLHVR